MLILRTMHTEGRRAITGFDKHARVRGRETERCRLAAATASTTTAADRVHTRCVQLIVSRHKSTVDKCTTARSPATYCASTPVVGVLRSSVNGVNGVLSGPSLFTLVDNFAESVHICMQRMQYASRAPLIADALPPAAVG